MTSAAAPIGRSHPKGRGCARNPQPHGGAAGAAVFYLILAGAPAAKRNPFTAASNLYGGSGFSLPSVALIEIVITALFLMVIIGATPRRAPPGFAPIAIGIAPTVI